MRNQDKLRALSSGNVDDLASLDDDNVLAFPTAIDIVPLPSQGKMYPEGHPWHNKESVEIKYMTAKEEDILTSKTFIAKHVVLEKFLRSIIVDKNVDIDSILVGDKVAISMAARVTGYGEHYKTSVRCSVCSHVNELDLNLKEFESTTYEDIASLDFGRFDGDGFYDIEDLPVTKANVKVRFITGKEEKLSESLAESKRKRGLPETSKTDFLKLVIVSVNGIDDRLKLDNFIKNLPAMDSKYIEMVYKKITPKVNLEYNLTCSECLAESDVEVPITSEFFWPKR